MSKETSVKFSYGMFISCIVIVLHHSVGDVFYDVGIWGGVIEYLHEGLFSFSMPFFFFWSGYFMMQKAQKEDIQHIISTKMRSLVIPYFAWNTIWTLFAVMLALIPLNIFSKSAVFVWDGKTVSILKGITLYQYNGQYWYLFQLIILTIFCKLIQRIVENRKLYVTVILLLLAICTIDTKVGFFSIEGLVCYLLGGFYSRNYEDPKLMKIRDNLNTLPKLAYPLSLIVLTVIITVSYETIPEYVLMIENLIACFLFWNCLDYFKHLKVYGWMEIYFFIYSFHETPQLIINKLFSVTVPLTGYAAALINTITGAVLTILVAELLAKILMTFSPKIWMILNGRRKFINSK